MVVVVAVEVKDRVEGAKMRDFLRGTLGKFLQILLALASVVLIFSGLLSCGSLTTGGTILGWVLFILGILCGCGVFGIRYWLGHVIRMR